MHNYTFYDLKSVLSVESLNASGVALSISDHPGILLGKLWCKILLDNLGVVVISTFIFGFLLIVLFYTCQF